MWPYTKKLVVGFFHDTVAGCCLAVHVVLVPVGLGCCVQFHIALFGGGQWLVCIILMSPNVFPGPAEWCGTNGGQCSLDYVKMLGEGVS